MYCTYMTHYTGDKLPPYYIGSTSINRIENGYHGAPSSKNFKSIWKSEQKDNPHLFKTTILNRHTTREEAYLDEIKWQTKLNVVESDLFANARILPSTCTRHGIKATEETKAKMSKAWKGKSKSEESKAKMSISSKGKAKSEEHKAKLSEAKLGEKNGMFGKTLSNETKAKISKSLKGKTRSEESKAKMSKAQLGRNRSEETKSKRGKNADNDT